MNGINSSAFTAIPGVVERVKPSPPQEVAHSISSFEITTDSVVAKATIATDTKTRRIYIEWGDGKSDTINIIPGQRLKEVDRVAGTTLDPLAEGTFEVFHAYDEPEDRRAFTVTVFLHVEDTDGRDDIRLRTISLTPRYHVVHYQARFRLVETCDIHSEVQNFRVVMYLDGAAVHEYPKLAIPNSPAGSVLWHLLEGSQFARDISADTLPQEIPRVRFKFTEFDWHLNDHGEYSTSLSYLMRSGQINSTFSLSDWWGQSCKIAVRYDREVTLIVNIPPVGGPATYAAKVRA